MGERKFGKLSLGGDELMRFIFLLGNISVFDNFFWMKFVLKAI